MTCETVGELLLDYVEGQLPAAQAQSVKAHLDECRACAAKCRETRALVGDLGAARSVEQRAWDSAASRPHPAQPTSLEPQARIGDFEILGEIGRGGMGVVYRARQVSLNRIVALKVLSAGLVQSERSVSRFAREAQAAARLHHTNIVPVYAQGREQDYFYYAMELIEGDSLHEILRKQREAAEDKTLVLTGHELSETRTRPLRSATGLLRLAVSAVRLSGVTRRVRRPRDYKRAARLIAAVAEGLHHAHEQGVVHRDIKPQNLLLGSDNQLHITDFGLARIRDEPGLTLSTEMVGTPAYMAREQIVGGGTGVDRRTDVYALGVTLYEMLTLERPFRGETYDETINQVLNREPKPPRKLDPHIPADLETICLRAMEKEPHRRFPTAAEMARDLRRYAEDYPIVSRRVGPVGKTVRWVRRHPAGTSAIGAAVLVVVLAPLFWQFFNATATAQINAAFNVLLDDYREKERALAELGWPARLAGDRQRYDLVQAFAHIRTDPQRSVEILNRVLVEHPENADAHYLLAFGYVGRSYTQGTEMLAEAQRRIELADGLGVEPSAAGWFFRGQAVWGTSPEEAASSFERAIEKASAEGFVFAQAMLHQGRALNQIMYSWRDITRYGMAEARLDAAARLQPGKAYPHYLLSITHMLAAEIRQSEKKVKEASAAYGKSLLEARQAQADEPSSARGYAAEAGYHESRGKFAARAGLAEWREHFEHANDAWRQLEDPALTIHTSKWDWSERSAYRMRLHFWLGEYREAERMRAARYGRPSGYDRERGYDADETFYEALIAASTGDWGRAEAALKTGVQLARERPEWRLRLHSAFLLVGRPPPSDLLPDDTSAECRLSPGWTPAWLAVLTRYVQGQADWPEVEEAAHAGSDRRDDERLRLAGAYFFQGVQELAAGQREQALTSLGKCCEQYDNENYCFRSAFLLIKLETDPHWPAWLMANDLSR